MEEQYTQQEPEKVETKPHDSTESKNIGMAVIAYILFFVPLLTDSKDDPFVKYHVKQGLVLFISFMIVSVITWTPLMFIGILGQITLTVLAIIGILNAVHGKKEPLPLIGHFSENFHF